MINPDWNNTLLTATRSNVLELVSPYDMDKLNEIPKGFSNNLVWNLGHILVTQQLLCYRVAGLDVRINPGLVDKYRKGSRPEERVEEEEIAYLKGMLLQSVTWLTEDFEAGKFTSFKSYPTSYGVTLTSIEDAIGFNQVHESMHYGVMLALRKML